MLATIAKQFTFDAAHRLESLPADHKCHRLHGHTYRVELVICGPVDEIGFVVDYAEIASWWDECFGQLDHRYLNDVPGIGARSTTEVIAAWIAVRILRRVNLFNAAHQSTRSGVSLAHVRVEESSTTWCIVHPVNISEADRVALLADGPLYPATTPAKVPGWRPG